MEVQGSYSRLYTPGLVAYDVNHSEMSGLVSMLFKRKLVITGGRVFVVSMLLIGLEPASLNMDIPFMLGHCLADVVYWMLSNFLFIVHHYAQRVSRYR